MMRTLTEPSTFFWLADGAALKNVEELSSALQQMTPEVFQHHVTPDKNDFSNWLHDILEEKKLAEQLRKATTKAEMTRLTGARLKQLKQRAKPNKKAVLTQLKDTFSNG